MFKLNGPTVVVENSRGSVLDKLETRQATRCDSGGMSAAPVAQRAPCLCARRRTYSSPAGGQDVRAAPRVNRCQEISCGPGSWPAHFGRPQCRQRTRRASAPTCAARSDRRTCGRTVRRSADSGSYRSGSRRCRTRSSTRRQRRQSACRCRASRPSRGSGSQAPAGRGRIAPERPPPPLVPANARKRTRASSHEARDLSFSTRRRCAGSPPGPTSWSARASAGPAL
jgi:hypothetical protein